MYAIFEVYEDLEGGFHFNLIAVCDTIEICKDCIDQHLINHGDNYFYGYTKSNKYTLTIDRNNFDEDKYGVGGYIIEEITSNCLC